MAADLPAARSDFLDKVQSLTLAAFLQLQRVLFILFYSAWLCRCHVLSNMVLTVDTSADRNAELMEAMDTKRMNETILNICCGLKIQ